MRATQGANDPATQYTVRSRLQAIGQIFGWHIACSRGADSGDTGADLLRQLKIDQQHPDVWLLDSAMPGMDGISM
ncbi:response regulator transcription factor [Janthinobacterium agaricidamnosum]|uniref:Response regulatory domain-containing protein n=1 Tax=Janthinobacterium agaricidamnosum NBRC 102515 = DSM 9628 TaxID=1349767 RepID=W0V1J9_9BURK|nr:response regulator transcription factor [Janthinobacterium agaricidamnosum]CDG82704.1 hypothetical protein GJA_2069 [Janthinobacterium agaricidamnosum NBRC 102515 = DSM 9628]